jgi:hypothetical protein
MAGQETPGSQFNAQADTAAQKLRQNLIQKGAGIPEGAPVEVGPDGKPPAPPPPEGSYVQRAQQQVERAEQVVRDPEPPQEPTEPVEPPPPEPSDNANRRIQELVAQLREKERALQEATSQSQQVGETAQQMQARLDELQRRHNEMIAERLDTLDPDTRTQVLASQQVEQAVQGLEQRIFQKIQPTLERFERRDEMIEMDRLANRYPGFNIETHGPLIKAFRERNRACTLEQAFRAVAEPEELVGTTARATAAPPVVQPGSGQPRPRSVPEPQQQADPEAELVQEAQALKKLMREGSPEERSKADRLWHEHMKKRVFGS